jgi:signal peptidase I
VVTLKRAGRLASGAALLAGIAAAALVLLPSVLGLERYVIVSGSMTGTYDEGTLLLSEVVPTEELRVGDVITYLPPSGDHLVTHRIVSIDRDAAGRIYRTKGDANPVADPWTFRLDGETQARAAFGVPKVGHLLDALGRRDVRMAVIALPALVICLLTLSALWRRLGVEAARA